MKKTKILNKVLALALALVMCLGLLPMSAFAATDASNVTEGMSIWVGETVYGFTSPDMGYYPPYIDNVKGAIADHNVLTGTVKRSYLSPNGDGTYTPNDYYDGYYGILVEMTGQAAGTTTATVTYKWSYSSEGNYPYRPGKTTYTMTVKEPRFDYSNAFGLTVGGTENMVLAPETSTFAGTRNLALQSVVSSDESVVSATNARIENGNVVYDCEAKSAGTAVVTATYTLENRVGPNLVGDYSWIEFTVTQTSTITVTDPTPAKTYTVTYTDGVPGEIVFPDRSFEDLKAGDPTPQFPDSTTRPGYTFEGWSPAVNTVVDPDAANEDGEIVYTATWQQNQPETTYNYTLSYDANGGEGAPVEQTEPNTTATSHTFEVASGEPTRDGYAFRGWADTADATAVQYQAGDEIELKAGQSTKTIYAVWTCEHTQGDDGYCENSDCDHDPDCTCGGKNPGGTGDTCDHTQYSDGTCSVPGCTHKADGKDCCGDPHETHVDNDPDDCKCDICGKPVACTHTANGCTETSGCQHPAGCQCKHKTHADNDGDGICDTTGCDEHVNCDHNPDDLGHCKVDGCNHTSGCCHNATDDDDDGICDICDKCLHVKDADGYCTEENCNHESGCCIPAPAKIVTIFPIGGKWADDNSTESRDLTPVNGEVTMPEADAIKSDDPWQELSHWQNEQTGEEYKPGYPITVTDPTTVVPVWKTKDQVTVFFCAEGGEFENGKKVQATIYAKGDKLAQPGNPSRTGFDFVCWTNEAGEDVTPLPTTVDKDLVFLAKWADNTKPVVMNKITAQHAFANTDDAEKLKENYPIVGLINITNNGNTPLTGLTLAEKMDQYLTLDGEPTISGYGADQLKAAVKVHTNATTGRRDAFVISLTDFVLPAGETITIFYNAKLTEAGKEAVAASSENLTLTNELMFNLGGLKSGDKNVFVNGTEGTNDVVSTASAYQMGTYSRRAAFAAASMDAVIKVANDEDDFDFSDLEDLNGATSDKAQVELEGEGEEQKPPVVDPGDDNDDNDDDDNNDNPPPVNPNPPITTDDDDDDYDDDDDGDDLIDIGDTETPLASAIGLNSAEHMAYIIGYDDGTVRPENYITRAEVATIFFRLMTDVYRATNWSTENDFSDVTAGNWCNAAVSTCGEAGLVAGYSDGTFRPDQYITRAEFATIAARLLEDEIDGSEAQGFSDIEGHWAEQAILRAAQAGWVGGDGDGTFRPEDYISRAEVMTVVNRMLGRTPDAGHMVPKMKVWADNPEGVWYYEAVQEATNEHSYTRDDNRVESWDEVLEVRDWKALEAQWAKDYAAD